MMKPVLSLLLAAGLAGLALPALAWGPEGHQTVGAIADQLLTANARQHVHDILQYQAGHDLQIAATWPDCVRSVKPQPDGTLKYTIDADHPEYQTPCVAFMPEVGRMEDYATRNWSNCPHTSTEGCNANYHFADIDYRRGRYVDLQPEAELYDIVHAIDAALSRLKGQPVPRPFDIKDDKEALTLIAHFVGDLHQPLHVGAIYLDETGAVLPASPAGMARGSTHGGNSILDTSVPPKPPKPGKKPESPPNLHSQWDHMPAALAATPAAQLKALGQAVPPMQGDPGGWAEAWASDTVAASAKAFAGLTFKGIPSAKPGGEVTRWELAYADKAAYLQAKTQLQDDQIVLGGAHLAALLNAIWP